MVDQPAHRAATVTDGPIYVSWGAVVAGAIAASALSLVLLTFGAGIGLVAASPSATWRDASSALTLTSGLWLLLTALASFFLGGYVAGRMRTTWNSAVEDEIDFRDGIHGLLAWGLAVLISALVAIVAVRSVVPQAIGNVLAPTASTAEPLLAFEIDRLFRSDRRPGDAIEPDVRAQAARIITTSLGHADLAADDRAYLVRLVAAKNGLSQPDAERRVAEVLAQAKKAMRTARANAVILAFMTAASFLAGAAAAWFAAGLGGRHRDSAAVPSFWLRKTPIPTSIP